MMLQWLELDDKNLVIVPYEKSRLLSRVSVCAGAICYLV